MDSFDIIILAAGIGSRMKSSLPKSMHLLGGTPLIDHIVYKANLLNPDRIISVIGEDMPDMEYHLAGRTEIAYQKDRLGSGHAVLTAKDNIDNKKDGVVLIIYGDTPLISVNVLQELSDMIRQKKADLGLVAFHKEESNQYGRLVLGEVEDEVVSKSLLENSRKKGQIFIKRVVEYADATGDEKKISLCNSGVMAIRGDKIWEILESIENKNSKGEYYLTDAIEIANKQGLICGYVLDSEDNLQGANTKEELARLEYIFQQQKRKEFLEDGVQMIDPSTVYFAMDTKIGRDVLIEPNVCFGKGVELGNKVNIKAFSVLEGVKVGDACSIGPFARIRTGSILDNDVHIGNFVEVKKSHLKDGVKAGHLSYLGDSCIGAKVNIGAGTITCNYDGKDKHKTNIGSGTFVGSNSSLVAPVDIGDNAFIGAGSTITKSVPSNTLAIGRGVQRNIENWKKS